MRRFVLIALLAAACGTNDLRPATVEVVSEEILAPTCGQVQCHSTTSNVDGYAFDTLAAAKVSLKLLVPGDNRRSLMKALTDTGGDRMPPDSPLDDADITLIETWIGSGAHGL
jgi:hypothetical protein